MSINNSDIFVSKIDGEDEELLHKNYRTAHYKRFNGYVLRDKFEEYADRISKMNIRDEDIWVCSYPKTGTTWTQEMVWCIANNFNITTAESLLSDRYIFLDGCFLSQSNDSNKTNSRQIQTNKLLSETSSEQHEAPRFIKTHLPYDFLPEMLKNRSTKAKIICVTRNPRDTCISSFHHQRFMGRFTGSQEDYCDMFMKGLVPFGPFFKNVLSYWDRRHDENLLFLKYEDMKKDLPSVIRKTARFLGITTTPTDNCMTFLCKHLSFNSMKNNSFIDNPGTEIQKNTHNSKGEGSFFRKGETDQWKKDFELGLIDRFEKWEKENLNIEFALTF